MSVEAVKALYEGIHAAAKDYQVDIVGGDTTRRDWFGLITLIGELKHDSIVYRNGAKEEISYVYPAISVVHIWGYKLEREKEVFRSDPNMQPKLDKYSYIVGRQLRPKARMDMIYELGFGYSTNFYD